MLTTILSTPRTGSTSFYYSCDSRHWIPDNHPGIPTSEYFGFRRVGNYRNQCKHYFNILKEKVSDNENIVIKIVLPMLHQDPEIMHEVLSMSDTIFHTVRHDYTSQLKSLVIANYTREYNPFRKTEQVTIPEEEIETKHQFLTAWIKHHAELYKAHGGELVVLEDRVQQRYANVPNVTNINEWPTFDTATQFKQ